MKICKKKKKILKMGDKKVTDLFKVIELLLTSQSSPRTSAEETILKTISALGSGQQTTGHPAEVLRQE